MPSDHLDPEPQVLSSALRHGLSEEGILHAWRQAMWLYEQGDGFTMIIGPDQTGAFVEVGVVDSLEGPKIVHAMPARPKFIH